jgi:hypothetical protein
MLYQSPPHYFRRHLQHYLIACGGGAKLLAQVKQLVSILSEDKTLKQSMAEKATELSKSKPIGGTRSTSPPSSSPHLTNPSSAADEDDHVEVDVEVGPSTGFLLALQRMIPTLEKLFS